MQSRTGSRCTDLASIKRLLAKILGEARHHLYRGRICSWCRTVLNGLKILQDDCVSPESGRKFDWELKSLSKSAKRYCYICSVIWKDLNESLVGLNLAKVSINELPVQITYQLHEDQTVSSPILELDIYLMIDIPSISEQLRVDKLFVLHAKSEVSQILGGITSKSTKSDESFRTAQKWIKECHSQHQRCYAALEKGGGTLLFPTRLIDISRGKEMRLCEFPTSSPNVRYAALSYCWGDRRFKHLTVGSYVELQDSIRFTELPQTFRDAVNYTRSLGLEYIWIDSLCIIQDCPNDWQRESAKMQDIYANSYITIAATHCHSSDQSLYSERLPKLLNPPTISLCLGNPSFKRYRLIDHATWNSEIQESPLDSRGWVLQERLLSTRVLHFGQRQLVWECLENDATENLPRGLLDGRAPMGDTMRFKDFFPEPNLRPGINYVLKDQYEKQWWPYVLWGRVVENYSQRQLSYPSDKLIAISGIARMFRKSFRCDYIAGLWSEHIERQLLWHRDDIPITKPNKPVYRAPSWSWASVDGRICQPLCWDKASILADVVSVNVKNVASNKYGMVEEGHLIISGSLKPIALGILGSGPNFIKTVTKREMAREFENPLLSPYPEVRLDYNISGARGFYCLPVYYNEANQELRGLILCPEAAEGFYQRVGTFWSWEPENIEAILRDIGTKELAEQQKLHTRSAQSLTIV